MDTLTSTKSAGSTVNIVTCLLLVINFLAISSRLVTKWAVSHRLNVDDLLLGIAFVFAIGNGISVSVEGSNGLGSSPTNFSDVQHVRLLKAHYSANILFIVTLYFTRLSSIAFLRIITPNTTHQRISLYYIYFTSIWAIVSVITSVFQCSPPKTWMFDGNKCLDQYAFWIVILTFEMLLNVVLTIIPLYILWNLRVRRAQKFAILCCFGTRMLIVGALIGETVLLHKVEHSRDLILNAWTSTIASQVVLSLSFIIPCLPYLKPFLESLDSGILGNEFYEESHRIGQSTTRSKTNATGDSSFTLQRLGGRSKLSTKISSRSYDVTLGKERLPSDDVTTPYKGIKRSNMSVGSNASQSKMIKVRTSLDWEVEREHDHEGIE